MNYVNYATSSNGFQIFDERSRISSIRIRRVDTLGGKVVKLAKVSVHDNLFFIRVLEWLASGNGTLVSGHDRRTPLQTANVSSKYVHEHRFGNVIGVVACHELINSK
jgi:DNA-binding cell septation regulator SpoVG